MLANDLAGLQEVLQGISQAGDIKFAAVLTLQGGVLASTRPECIGHFLLMQSVKNAARMTVFRDADKKSPHCQEQQYGLVERLFWRCTPFKLSKTNASNKFYIIQSLVFFLAGLVHHKQPEWFNLAGFYFQQAVN